MIYTIEDLERAFEAGANWKEKYSKTVDDEIRVPDFEKFTKTNYMVARNKLPVATRYSEEYIRVPITTNTGSDEIFEVYAFVKQEVIDYRRDTAFIYKPVDL